MGKGVVAAGERSNKKQKIARAPSSIPIHCESPSPLKRNPSPNRESFPRRITRRNAILAQYKDEEEDDDDRHSDDDDDDVKTKEKKLKLVHKLPHSFGPQSSPKSHGRADASESVSNAESEDDDRSLKARKIGSFSETKKPASRNGLPLAGDACREIRSVSA